MAGKEVWVRSSQSDRLWNFGLPSMGAKPRRLFNTPSQESVGLRRARSLAEADRHFWQLGLVRAACSWAPIARPVGLQRATSHIAADRLGEGANIAGASVLNNRLGILESVDCGA